jgi:hypothetical protein
MRTWIAFLLLMVAGNSFAQVQTDQQAADIAKKSVNFLKGRILTHKANIQKLTVPVPGVKDTTVSARRAYAAGLQASNGAPLADAGKMARGDQRAQDGDNEAAAGDTSLTTANGLDSQGDAAYSSGDFINARKFYRQAVAPYGEAEKHFSNAVSGYIGAGQYYELAIRP